MTNYSILVVPPEALIVQWSKECKVPTFTGRDKYMAECAAQWGADIELGACREWLRVNKDDMTADFLYDARRPDPVALKKKALRSLEVDDITAYDRIIIRHALEALAND